MDQFSLPSTITPTEEVPAEVGYQYDEVIQLAKTDMDFFAGLALPEVYKYPFPDLYLQFWSMLTSALFLPRDFSQYALGLPRGFAKTLVIKLLILYAILYTPKKFILILCENEDKGKSILADVADMLSENNIVQVFGDWTTAMESDTLIRKKFSYRGKNIIIKCAGAGTGIRGISEKFTRPDLMIFDDIQSREESESEPVSKALETWMTATAMKAKSPEGCTFIFVANMYPTKGSLLRKLKQNPNWIKFIVGGILADGSSLWEQLQPIAQLLKEFQNDLAAGQPQIFYSEVLNDETASVNTAFDVTAIPAYPYTDYEVVAGAFVIIDPATDKVNADHVAILGVIMIDGRPVARKVKAAKLSPGDIIREALKIAIAIGASLIAIEGVAFQYSLLYWTNIVFQQLGISGITVIDVYPGSTSKNSRILNMFKMLVPPKTGEPTPDIVLHPEVKALVADEAMGFNPLKSNNTDNILDCLTYVHPVIQQHGHLIAINASMEDRDIPEDTYGDNNTPF
jgi:hypothetical protein